MRRADWITSGPCVSRPTKVGLRRLSQFLYADLTDPQTLNLYSYVRNNPHSKLIWMDIVYEICALAKEQQRTPSELLLSELRHT